MRLVLNSTVISNFALIGRVGWLAQLWQAELVTSEQAMAELMDGVQRKRIPRTDWSWLGVVALSEEERELSEVLMPPLDAGEASCLALARSRGYAFLTDDRVARRESRRWGVPLSGTIGVLVSLIEEGAIFSEEADLALQEMIALGYRSPVRSLSELT
jgi:predicted nucleic acid-binding protein